ncbi:Med18 protein [Dictyocaulus viviparus]|uniref:Mediator of RNA polymerase II transcription subunit 18 n=1 Tax=Dictyocaulus viviparus TaxID=29172 RepID=A0A0D8XII8_DICVI|nr:Med18 protein [Dictyocaulus viviparus]
MLNEETCPSVNAKFYIFEYFTNLFTKRVVHLDHYLEFCSNPCQISTNQRSSVMDRSDDDAEGGQAALTSMPYQCQELILYGSVFADNLPDLERRLTGLCDPGSTEFHEHDLSFSLRTGTDPDVTIRLRRRFNVDSFTSHQWQFRYIGGGIGFTHSAISRQFRFLQYLLQMFLNLLGPEPDQKCPVIVRKVIDSIAYSHLMMDFVKTLGLRMDYEYIAKGTAGHYDQSNLKRFSDSYLVEISVCIPESAEYTSAAKQLRDFADQLLPLVEMEKVDYWRK